MKHNKDLQFCIDKLKSLQNRDESGPEQKSALEVAQRKLKWLKRKSNPARAEIFRVVRQVAETIFNILEHE